MVAEVVAPADAAEAADHTHPAWTDDIVASESSTESYSLAALRQDLAATRNAAQVVAGGEYVVIAAAVVAVAVCAAVESEERPS